MAGDNFNDAVAQIIVALIQKDEIVIKNPNDYQEEVTTAIERVKMALSS